MMLMMMIVMMTMMIIFYQNDCFFNSFFIYNFSSSLKIIIFVMSYFCSDCEIGIYLHFSFFQRDALHQAINTKFEHANGFYPCQSICVATSATVNVNLSYNSLNSHLVNFSFEPMIMASQGRRNVGKL